MKAMYSMMILMSALMMWGVVGCSKGGSSSNNSNAKGASPNGGKAGDLKSNPEAIPNHAVTDAAKKIAKQLEGSWDAGGNKLIIKNGRFPEAVTWTIDETNLNRKCETNMTYEIYDVVTEPGDFTNKYLSTQPDFALEVQAVKVTLLNSEKNDAECEAWVKASNDNIASGKASQFIEYGISNLSKDMFSMVYEEFSLDYIRLGSDERQ